MHCRTALSSLRRLMAVNDIDAYVVRISDPYLSEYIPRHWAALEWLSGFTGSAGTLVVTAESGMLYTDSRYWEQAEEELQGSGLELVRQGKPGEPDIAAWLTDHVSEDPTIAACPDFFSVSDWERWDEMLARVDMHLDPIDDLIEDIWTENRPARPVSPVRELSGAGLRVSEKLARLRSALNDKGADATLLCALDDIAWLTNSRASDIDFNPVFLATMAVTVDRAVLFTESSRFSPEHRARLEAEGVVISDEKPFPAANDLFGKAVVLVDPDRISVGMMSDIDCETLLDLSPVTLMKSRKSPDELENIRDAMRRDGAALCEFYAALDASLEKGEAWDELKASRVLRKAREAQGAFDLSFETIAAFGKHAALPHYGPSEESNATFTEGLLLIDSGGQYDTGTTDITRMTAVGRLTAEMRRDVTAVLKAMIALASGVFPEGASGAQLDAVARAALWQEGLDFGHGTGHGVGYVLNVHEGPFRVSPYATQRGTLGLQPGLVFSDEPGLYRPGHWGVRIENLVAAGPLEETVFGRFIRLEMLTLCPIDRRTFDIELLSDKEIRWIDDYHAKVRDALESRLTPSAKAWLLNATKPLCA